MLPWADVRSGVADQRVDYGDPAAYDLWAATIREVTGRARFDLLLTSEPAYGDETAVRLEARHVLVDPARVAVPVSATVVSTAWGPAMSPHATPAMVNIAAAIRLVPLNGR